MTTPNRDEPSNSITSYYRYLEITIANKGDVSFRIIAASVQIKQYRELESEFESTIQELPEFSNVVVRPNDHVFKVASLQLSSMASKDGDEYLVSVKCQDLMRIGSYCFKLDRDGHQRLE